MVKYLAIFTILFSCLLLAQDTIYKTDGSEIQSKVIEITSDAIKYKKFSNLDGPIYNVPIADVFMIVYENGEREVFKKTETPPPPPPQQPKREEPVQNQPVQTPPPPDKEQPTVETTSSSETKYQHTGLYAGFLGGVIMPQSMTFEESAGSFTQKVELDEDLDSRFSFVAHAAWQTDNLAFLIAGAVNTIGIGDRDLFTMSYWGAGLNYYFSLEQFSPYLFIRAGLGFGKFQETLVDNSDLEADFTLTGYMFGFGTGTKIYLDKSWGLLAELGYQISSQSVEDKIKDNRDNSYDYEFSNDTNAISISVGFFFYP